MTSRHWCFTSFDDAKHPPQWVDGMRYLVFQGEEAPETKRFHWQGYVQFIEPKRLTGVKKILGKNAHLEKTEGSATQAADYCRLPEYNGKKKIVIVPPVEFGEIAEMQGQRSDLKNAYAAALRGDMKAVEAGTYVKFHRGLEAYFQLHSNTPRKWPMVNIVLWGPTGACKSRYGWDLADEKDVFTLCKLNTGWWWSGYRGEHTVMINEFDPSSMDVNYFLQLLDRYPMQVALHGGMAHFRSRRIIITSHTDPSTWYPARWPEVRRRLSQVKHMVEDGPIAEKYKMDDFLADEMNKIPVPDEYVERAPVAAPVDYGPLLDELYAQAPVPHDCAKNGCTPGWCIR